MRQLHFDLVSGIAGDMALGALLHLGAPLSPLQEALRAMGLRKTSVSANAVRPHGISAIRFCVSGEEEPHSHRSFAEIRGLISRAGLPPGARERAEAIFIRLAEAEARVHGTAIDDVVFHEVGAVDSIADVVGCALALDHFSPERITSTEPLTGFGITQSRHGSIPVPAPATLEILKGIRIRGVDLEAELTTPTGAAILATQVQQFTNRLDLIVESIGYGAGSREIPGRPNLLRALLGESTNPDSAELLIEGNIDDMSPAQFEHLLERLLEAGALDVWLQPVIMKKSRPAVVLGLLCEEARAAHLENIIFSESTTIGLRRQAISRRRLARRIETVSTPFGPVRVKIAGEGTAVFTVSPEYEDCRARALEHQVPLKTVFQAARTAWENQAHEVEKP